jgi:hypothetical protein
MKQARIRRIRPVAIAAVRWDTTVMRDRSNKRPRDRNQPKPPSQTPKYNTQQETAAEAPKNPHAVALGRLGGLKGGAARAAFLSPKKRSQIAAKAAAARWGKKR